MTPHERVGFNNYEIQENYDFIEDESIYESNSESESESELEPNEEEVILYEFTFNNGVTKIFYDFENIHGRDVEECDAFLADLDSEDYEEAKFNSAITRNGKYLIHPLADIIRDSWI